MIPFATTTITVRRRQRSESEDTALPYQDDPNLTFITLASGVRAVIGSPQGQETVQSGVEVSRATFRLNCDPCVIDHADIVVDETTGITYQVVWVIPRLGLAIDHTVGDLVLASGALYSNA